MLQLTHAEVTEFNPEAQGWTAPILINLREFPEAEGREMVFQRDAYVRGSERLVIEWDRSWVVLAVAHNGEWLTELTYARIQEIIRGQVIDGQTAEEFLAELFEFELCAECAGDVKDHIAKPDQFGKWHAWCSYEAPRMMQFVITSAPGTGQQRAVRLEQIDSGDVVREAFASPASRQHPLQRLTYGSAMQIEDEALKVAACDLLAAYRKEQHSR